METFVNNLIEFVFLAYIYAVWAVGITLVAWVFTLIVKEEE
jgi:hypothetical protein